MVFEGISLYTNLPTRIRVQDGHIATVETLDTTKNEHLHLSPGFVDLQVNGYRGQDYSSPDLSILDIKGIVRDLAQSGTLRHLPTIITSSQETMLRNLGVIAGAVREDAHLKNSIPGIHLEGPFLSPQDGARGAHSLRHIRPPDKAQLDAWQQAAEGLVRIITIAPETDGAVELIRHAKSLGIIVALGHSLASTAQIAAAVAAGASLSTHLGNGSPALLPRLVNPIWAQLAQDGLTASIITDGYHLPDEVIKVFARAKGAERLVLVSDVGSLGGMAPGRYYWGDTLVEVALSGRLGVADTEYLAGAGHLLDTCIPVFMRASGASLKQAVSLASTQPACLLGLPSQAEGFVPGAPADLVLFEVGTNKLKVQAAALKDKTYTF